MTPPSPSPGTNTGPGPDADTGSGALPGIVSRLRRAGCVFAEDEAALILGAATTPARLEDLVSRRVAGLPLEHVLGWACFAGHRVVVEPGVFVPRHRSEFLVRTAARLVREQVTAREQVAARQRRAAPEPAAGQDPAPAGGGSSVTVLDLCCGSGALGLAVAHDAGTAVDLHASDIDPASVRCARLNLEGVGGTVHEGDLFAPLPTRLRGRVAVLIANVPYVPTGMIEMMPPEARLHEPRVALDGGKDGLEVFRRVLASAPAWLAPGGHLLIEAGEEQAVTAAAEIEAAGLRATVVHDHGDGSFEDDESTGATVVVATLPAAGTPSPGNRTPPR